MNPYLAITASLPLWRLISDCLFLKDENWFEFLICLLKSWELVECYKIGNLDFLFHLQRGTFLFSFTREGNICSWPEEEARSIQSCWEALMHRVTSLWNRMKDGKQDNCAKRNCFNHSMCSKVFCINLEVGRKGVSAFSATLWMQQGDWFMDLVLKVCSTKCQILESSMFHTFILLHTRVHMWRTE